MANKLEDDAIRHVRSAMRRLEDNAYNPTDIMMSNRTARAVCGKYMLKAFMGMKITIATLPDAVAIVSDRNGLGIKAMEICQL